MRYMEIERFWNENEDVQRLKLINKHLEMLRDILSAKKVPVTLKNDKMGIIIKATLTQSNQMLKKPIKHVNFFQDAPTSKDIKLQEILSDALQKRYCNGLPDKEIGILYIFFSDLKIGVE